MTNDIEEQVIQAAIQWYKEDTHPVPDPTMRAHARKDLREAVECLRRHRARISVMPKPKNPWWAFWRD